MAENVLYGFCMALADSVPGVSGGTVAVLLGFYEPFLEALNGLLGKETALRKKSAGYFLRLGAGWVPGMVLSVLVISDLIKNHPYFLTSLFLGLTAAGIPVIFWKERETVRNCPRGAACFLTGAALVVVLTILRQSGLGMGAVSPVSPVWMFSAGAAAASAMLLPGISGSTLLCILGMYHPVIQTAHGLLRGDWAVLPAILALVMGAVVGLFGCSGLIRNLLNRHRAQMLCVILGLMTGSLYAIAAGPAIQTEVLAPLSFWNFDLAGFELGLLLLMGMELMKSALLRKKAA